MNLHVGRVFLISFLFTNDNQINNVDIGLEFSTIVITEVYSSPSNVALECIIIVMKKFQIFGELTLKN